MGRPPVLIETKELQRLGRLNPTLDEVAAYFGCSRRTIERRFKEDDELYEKFEAGKAMGRLAIRRKQMQILEENDNPIMAIWLGKQLLGQRDKHDVVSEDRRGANLAEAFKVVADMAKQKQMEPVLVKANGTQTHDGPLTIDHEPATTTTTAITTTTTTAKTTT